MTPAATAALGRRERNKAEKLQRIRQAARELFVEKGYDDTTIREIAQRADVGFGTLFTYASNKRDLLFLIFNDALDEIVAEAAAAAVDDRPFIDQLLAFFGRFYRFYGKQPALSRFALRELTFYCDGKQARQFQDSRNELLRQLVIIVAKVAKGGGIASREEPELLARALFAAYAAELRRWLGAEEPDLAAGLEDLERMLRLQITGFGPREGAL